MYLNMFGYRWIKSVTNDCHQLFFIYLAYISLYTFSPVPLRFGAFTMLIKTIWLWTLFRSNYQISCRTRFAISSLIVIHKDHITVLHAEKVIIGSECGVCGFDHIWHLHFEIPYGCTIGLHLFEFGHFAALFQYPMRRFIVRSHEVSKPWDW